MEEFLKMPDNIFFYKGKYYKLIDFKDGELELEAIIKGGYLTAQIDDDEVFAFFEDELETLKDIYEYYKGVL